MAYKARRDALTAALQEAFAPEELHLTGLHTGLHLLAELRDPPPDDALRAAAEAEGVAGSRVENDGQIRLQHASEFVHVAGVADARLHDPERLVAVGAERAHLHVVLRFEDGLQRHPNERVVIDDKRPDHDFSFDGSFGTVANTRKPLR